VLEEEELGVDVGQLVHRPDGRERNVQVSAAVDDLPLRRRLAGAPQKAQLEAWVERHLGTHASAGET
jgi:hypothetical protein